MFDRDNGGFDAFVGNPPFAGKNSVTANNAVGYQDWLKEIHAESHGNADLVSHFFRRAFNLLRQGGCFGLIATTTIAQGDTRASGLRWICGHGGEIYNSRTRYSWPGQAAVVVSVVHVAKDIVKGPKLLDGRSVPNITAFLFHAGGNENPQRLKVNRVKSFQGSIVLGMGFTFDDTDTKGVATPTTEMNRLLADNLKNQEAIFPYIGGEEVNTHPSHFHHRYVINFKDYPLRRDECAVTWEEATDEMRDHYRHSTIVPLDYPGRVAYDWQDLIAIVDERVKPERLSQNDLGAKEKWWQFIRPRPELHSAVSGLEWIIVVNCGATPHHAFTFLPSEMVYAHSLAVFPSTITRRSAPSRPVLTRSGRGSSGRRWRTASLRPVGTASRPSRSL